MNNFGRLCFEYETTVSSASSWVLAANAAEVIAREKDSQKKM